MMPEMLLPSFSAIIGWREIASIVEAIKSEADPLIARLDETTLHHNERRILLLRHLNDFGALPAPDHSYIRITRLPLRADYGFYSSSLHSAT